MRKHVYFISKPVTKTDQRPHPCSISLSRKNSVIPYIVATPKISKLELASDPVRANLFESNWKQTIGDQFFS